MKPAHLYWALAMMSLPVVSHAADFTPKFSDYAFSGTQYTVDAAANTYFSTNYGITIENAYLYRDSRDTYDGIGISNGEVSGIGDYQVGRINFLDTTNYLEVEAWTQSSGKWEAFTSGGVSLGSYNLSKSSSVLSFSGLISYLLFSGTGGYVQVSGLTYNYDGVTDGRNNDISSVPIPAAFWLFSSALLGVLGLRRKV